MSPIRLLSLTLLLLTGCQTLATQSPAPAAEPVVASAATGPAANDGLNATAWFQTSVEYRLVAGETYRSALAQLDKAIKTPDWDALANDDRQTPARGLPPAIIVDIDETVLDNSPYQARLIRSGKSFDDAAWLQWINEQSAAPIPGALEFLQAAAHRGVTIFYVSNRDLPQTPATLENLRKRGFPVNDASQVMLRGTVVAGCDQAGSGKGCRRQLVGRGHRVLMQFGDQLGDLVTIADNTPEGREQTVTPYLGWIGERWFVLPNPMYGSWLPALYDNDSKLPDDQRRQKIYDQLRH
jgi:acid phosphatase